jgi:capsular polysaccharide transport system permease protein
LASKAVPRVYFSGLGFIDHIRILRALILNDLRIKYRGNSFGFALELLRPTVVIAAHYYLFLFLKKPMPANLPILTFVIAGFPVWFAFNGTLQAGIHGTRSAAQAILIPRVTTFHVKLAKATWAVLLNFMFCICASWPLIFFFRQDLPLPDISTSVLVFVLAGALGFGLGLISEQLSKKLPIFDIFTKLLAWALYVTSGQYFCIMTVQREWAQILWFNPLIHLVEYERHAFDVGYPIAIVNLSYPTVFAVSLLMLALMGKKAARHGALA